MSFTKVRRLVLIASDGCDRSKCLLISPSLFGLSAFARKVKTVGLFAEALVRKRGAQALAFTGEAEDLGMRLLSGSP